MSIKEILSRVNDAINEPFNEAKVFEVYRELHAKLSEPKWAIEDEGLRKEMEELFVQMTVMQLREKQ